MTSFDVTRLVRFGVFEVDLKTGELRKRGQLIALQEQPFQILAALLEQPGEVVTREELRRKLWPAETFVDFDHSMNVAVRRLRDALGESAESPVFIETVARRGYRFIGPLAKEQQAPATSTINTPAPKTGGHSRRNILIAIGAASALAVGGLLFWWAYRTAPISPRITSSKQLTFSGQIGSPYFTDALQSIQTDGQRIYYTDKVSRLRFVSVTGGDEGYVQTDASVALLHISPDGSKLLVRDFIGSEGSSEGRLWLVPANGGARQRLGDIRAQDAAWSPDGKTIAFAQGSNLFLTDDLGSPPRKLATTPGHPFWLRWSPNGKVLRFTLNDTKTDLRTLWEANLSGSIEQLFAGWKDRDYSCCGIWVQEGRFLFLHISEGQAQIWALPENKFARNHFEPVPVSVNHVGITFMALASSSSQKRLFVLGLNPLAEVFAVDPKDKRPVQPLPKLPAHDLIFSQDGKWVTFFSEDATKSLWRAHADGTNPTQLTSPPLEVGYPVFSPDASRIAMMARSAGQPFKIYWVNAEGGTLHELHTDVTNQADPTWSADGESIIFGEPTNLWVESDKPKAMYISNLKSGQTSKIPGSEGWFAPRMSPDGRTLAALSLDFKRIGLFDFQTARWRDLPQPNVPNGSFWSADSQWLYFNAGDDEIWRLRVRDGQREFVMSTSSLLPNHACYASGFTPQRAIILPCIRRSSDLYELDWE